MPQGHTPPTNRAEPERRIGQDEFVALLVRHDRRLRGFIAAVLGRVTDIDEVLQNVCLVAWKKMDQFRYHQRTPDEDFLRWICTIARYEVMAYHRAQSKSPLLLDAELMDRVAAMQIAESSYLEDRHRALAGCLQRLRPRDREMTRQRYEAGISAADLAAGFGVGVDAVYKALTRIRATLLECVERTMRREEYQ
jgi:RNA polymerase sigma-70 factor, ECF subfamily